MNSDDSESTPNEPEYQGLPTGIVHDPIYAEHDTGPGHPERPERVDAIMDGLRASDFWDELEVLSPRAASEEEILACHTKPYFDAARSDIEQGRSGLRTGDTTISERSWEPALKAAGGLLTAVDKVMSAEANNAFCLGRPPGHHASPARGMGFCVFNNVAIGARYAQMKYGLERVLIADWDVHHGNGTQDAFYEDGSVFFFSTHQYPWYPGTGVLEETGEGEGEGTTQNCPVPAGSGKETVVRAFEEILVPAADEFQPDFVMISAGFDSRIGDPLGYLRLTDDDFAELTWIMLQIANKHAEGRLVSTLEGGYSLSGLANGAVAHCRSLVSAGR